MLQPIPYIITNRIQETPKIFSLELTPKTGSVFSFKPGQFVMLYLINASDPLIRTQPRAYSISSIYNGQNFIVTIKIKGEFTSAISELKIGDEIGVTGSYGAFTIPTNYTGSLVFLAAGVGVTPFRPMIESYLYENPSALVTLFLSIPVAKEYLYKEDWKKLTHKYPNFKIIVSTTKENAADWTGETRRIDETMLNKYVANCLVPIYFICGSATFVPDIQTMLLNLGIPAVQIKKESFFTPGAKK